MDSITPSYHQPQKANAREARRRPAHLRRRTAAGAAFGLSALLGWTFVGQVPAYAAEAPVDLGTAASYSVLGGTTVTNTGPTRLGGDLGVNPGTAVTGFPPGLAAGATNTGVGVAGTAQSNLTTAYNDAAGRTLTADVSGDLVGKTLVPGVYKSPGPLAVSGALTLDGQGNPNSVFIFQVASTLTTASASSIVLTNSAQACNVYWQVGSSATLGTASTFVGNILALTSITVTTGTTVQGRALARNGQVSLDTNVFTAPGCATSPTPSPSPSPSSTPSATPAALPSPSSARTAPPSTPAPAPAGLPTASPTSSPITGTDTGSGNGTDNSNTSGVDVEIGTGTKTASDTAAGTRRGMNIDTAAETATSDSGTVLGAAVMATVLAGVWMLAAGRRTVRRNR